MRAVVLLVLISTLCALLNAQAPGKRTLAVLDSSTIKETHSIFFKSLADRGHQITYATADSPISLHKFGEYLYDNLVLFAPKLDVVLQPSLTKPPLDSLGADDVVEFINAGHNVLLAADTGVSETIRDIASECGAELAGPTTAVIDHHNFDKSDFEGRHTAIIADDVIDAPVILGNKKVTHILFRGVGQEVRDSPLNYRLLSASSTAYSGHFDGKGAAPKILGKRNTLVSALQARNNARVVISGSLHLFSDVAFRAKLQKYDVDAKAAPLGQSGNEDFAIEVSKWAFQERGVIRYRDVHHSKANGETPNMYTIKDEIKYSIVIEELKDGKWVPYVANDVQLEFIMLDPYIRTNLKHEGNGKYTTQFTAPDVYGVFTFKVDYHRVGLSGINAISRIPVRPFRHDQYERFIPSAFPYYAGAFSMLAGLFIFSVVFLYHNDDKKKR